MINLLFNIFLHIGIIIPQNENDGRQTYTLRTESKVIEHAYKEEIINYIKTGVFVYNEDLE
jgi:hypothetical protein